MKKPSFNRKVLMMLAFFLPIMLFSISCEEQPGDDNGNDGTNSSTVFLLIDEESIDNGNEPNNFSETDVNDQLARIGLRTQLKYFSENVGKTIELYTGQVGDEGWHAPTIIPTSWKNAGPTTNGSNH